jgi:hypothetical protein
MAIEAVAPSLVAFSVRSAGLHGVDPIAGTAGVDVSVGCAVSVRNIRAPSVAFLDTTTVPVISGPLSVGALVCGTCMDVLQAESKKSSDENAIALHRIRKRMLKSFLMNTCCKKLFSVKQALRDL